jgi:ankyrin repeat protein
LFYAAAILSKLSDNEDPLVWAKRLAHRYVETRDPNTHISSLAYSIIGEADPAEYVFGDDFRGHDIRYGSMLPDYPKFYAEPEALAFPIRAWMCMLLLGNTLGSDGKEFRRWALEELTAWGKIAYRPEDNALIPMLTDGTSLEGYVLKRDGYFGAKGTMFKVRHPQGLEFWAYSMAYRITGDQFMREMARNIGKGNNFGDIGSVVNDKQELNRDTDCSDPYALLGFLELYRKTSRRVFMQMASRIGDNILRYRFCNGFFAPSKRHIYARFDNLEHLALLHLSATIESKVGSVPEAWPDESCFACNYRGRYDTYDVDLIFSLTDSSEPPISLHEAAALGDLERIEALLSNGADINCRERAVWSPLHRAVMSGHVQAIALLLAKGADIEAANSFGSTALHYVARQGHKKIADLLIAKDADVNAKNMSGDTPLHLAARAGHKDIVELLVAKDADVNIKNNEGFTPLHYVATRPRPSRSWLNALFSGDSPEKKMAELLISKGADVSSKDNDGHTPLWHARTKGNKEIVQVLRTRTEKEAVAVQKEAMLPSQPDPHDIALIDASTQTSCTRGDTISIKVNLENLGTCNEAPAIELTDASDALQMGKQTATLSVSTAATCNLTITGQDETRTQFGDWSWVGDVNNDGYDDILISAERWKHDGGVNDDRGRAYLFYGGVDMDAEPDQVFSGESPGDLFGDNGVYLADMNVDGFDDVIIGSRFCNNRGRVYVYWGAEKMDNTADIIIDPPSEDGSDIQFGRGITVGDLNGDGQMDLVVSGTKYNDWLGRIYLYYGPIASNTSVGKTFTGMRRWDTLGDKVCARGDVDGDGCDDLLTGIMYWPEWKYNGRAYLYYGAPGTTMDEHPDLVFDAEYPGDEFGSGVDLFDIDNDGYAEIIIGARRYPRKTFQGRVYLYWGSERALMDADCDLCFDGEIGAKAALGGESVMGGYVNGDEYGDIVVSAFDYKNFSQHGRSYIYYGGPKESIDTIRDHIFTGEQAKCQPQRTRVADFNGDGYGDIIMQGYAYNNYQGRCWLWYGPFAPSSTTLTFHWDTTNASIGRHTLKVEIPPVPGEQNIDNNVKTVTIEVKEPTK